jgi:hypothetical protein
VGYNVDHMTEAAHVTATLSKGKLGFECEKICKKIK